ncbi:MAG TPA: tripartite tricarboxylate transporter TctB family protein [Arenibaculum sp.]|nr:tripartite tricarboxylate transporter TctB family protein [Arenibaculum sp.]
MDSKTAASDTPTRADLITAVVLVALGIAVFYGSWTMPRLEARGIHPASAPGLVPGVLGLLLAACGGLLGLGAWRAGAHRRPCAGGVEQVPASRLPELRRLGAAMAICLAYALGLVGVIPFWLATAVFVFVFVLVFEGPLGETRTSVVRSVLVALVLAAATAGAVSYIFQELFLVRLP